MHRKLFNNNNNNYINFYWAIINIKFSIAHYNIILLQIYQNTNVNVNVKHYILLQLPMRKSSREVVFVNTSPPEDRVQLLKTMDDINEWMMMFIQVVC